MNSVTGQSFDRGGRGASLRTSCARSHLQAVAKASSKLVAPYS